MIVDTHNNQFECFFFALLAKCSSKQKLNRNMAEVLYSMSKPRRSDVTGAANQVYEMDDFVAFAIKTIRANNVSAISSVDTNGHFIHIHAPTIYDNLQGEPTETVGNASYVQGEFCIVKIKSEDLK